MPEGVSRDGGSIVRRERRRMLRGRLGLASVGVDVEVDG
jgi:hypothetical protein